MIHETENPQEANNVYLVDPVRYFTQSPQCWFSRGTSHLSYIAAFPR